MLYGKCITYKISTSFKVRGTQKFVFCTTYTACRAGNNGNCEEKTPVYVEI